MKNLDPAEGRLLFSVRVVPRASRNEIVGWTNGGALKVRLTAPPVENAANEELVAYLATVLDVRKRDVVIASGHRSKTKRLRVPERCKNRLLSFADI